MRFLVLMAVATLLFAGCTANTDQPGSDVAGDSSDEPTTVAGAVVASAAALANVTWGDELYQVREVFTGTFALTDTADLHGPTGGSSHRQVHDISSLVPIGRPSFVIVSVEATVDEGDIDVWLQTAPTYLWTMNCDCPFGGVSTTRSAVFRDGGDPFEFIVRYDEHDNQQDGFEYTATVEVFASDRVVAAGIPVEITLPAGGQVQVGGFDGNPINAVHVYGPDDSIVETMPGAGMFTAPIAGAYVFLQQGEGVGATFQAPPGAMARALPQAISVGAGATGATGPGSVSITAVAATTPVQVGFCAHAAIAYDPAISMTGPRGALDGRDYGGAGLVDGYGDCLFTPVGDERLAPGEYTFAYADTVGHEVQLEDYLIFYDR